MGAAAVGHAAAMSSDPWPLRHLVLRTPRLELRPDDDAGLFELAEEARLGVHEPDRMPFVTPWTDVEPDERAVGVLRWGWEKRAALRPERWSLHLLVRCRGRVVGMQEVAGTDFGVTREVMTGSWLGLRHQGRGIGTEMRAAVLNGISSGGCTPSRASSASSNSPASSSGRSSRWGVRSTRCRSGHGSQPMPGSVPDRVARDERPSVSCRSAPQRSKAAIRK